MKLRDYQIDLSEKAVAILKELHIVYIIAEVRTGKTLTALQTANLYGAKKVLFITKLKAISSIQNDYKALTPDFELQVINKESLHKITQDDFDLLIVDENHAVSSTFPKPNKAAKEIKTRFGHLPQIYLSGTPAIESGSQWFHSFWISNHSPFSNFKNFYGWAKEYTTPAIKHFGALKVNDYSKSLDDKILAVIEPYLVKFTQKEAGFSTEITEHILYHDLHPTIKNMVDKLCDKLVLQGKEETVLGDSPAKLMSKVHQIENGTVIFESGKTQILDTGKAEFIRDRFAGKKMAIFYYFKTEWELLKTVFGDSLTDNLYEFNTTDKHIALQQVSGSEGISLKAADVLIIYNNGYSGRHAVQMVDRMTTIDRKENNVYFIFCRSGINARIFKAVKSKRKYNDKMFMKDYARKLNTDRDKKAS